VISPDASILFSAASSIKNFNHKLNFPFNSATETTEKSPTSASTASQPIKFMTHLSQGDSINVHSASSLNRDRQLPLTKVNISATTASSTINWAVDIEFCLFFAPHTHWKSIKFHWHRFHKFFSHFYLIAFEAAKNWFSTLLGVFFHSLPNIELSFLRGENRQTRKKSIQLLFP
jgi:hypothetical protein